MRLSSACRRATTRRSARGACRSPGGSVSGSRWRAPCSAIRPLVVLDEPNAHLDGDGELALSATVRRLGERNVTVVLIAQRAGVMALVDQVLVLRAGAIENFGPRDEILPRLRRANIAAVRPGA